MEAFKIRNLTFEYPESAKQCLCGIDLDINEGEFFTLCGKSGCGKSTLLSLLKPVLSPHGEKNGSIEFFGEDISSLSLKRQACEIGFVCQDPDSQLVTDKVWHELAFGLENLGIRSTEIRIRVAEIAAFFGISSWFEKSVSELSGGQKQILNLAAVMVMQPKVLILDEPSSQLDPVGTHDFFAMLSKINTELGTTVILAEQRLEEAFGLSDRAAVIENGVISVCASPEEVCKSLYRNGSDMFSAIPPCAKISLLSGLDSQFCPINVRQGRQWLEEQRKHINNDAVFSDNRRDYSNVETAVSLSEVFFRYERKSNDVLNNFNVDIPDGCIFSFVGANGVGKSTLLALIAGILKPYRGKVRICTGKKVVLMPQNPLTLFTENTVYAELCCIFDSDLEKAGYLKEVIEICGLSELLYRHPYDLSGGERQRAALAKLLLAKPDILLLDEPTKGFDAHFKENFGKLLSALQKRGITIILVSHDIEFCAEYADMCALVFGGECVSVGTPREMFSHNAFYTTFANRMSRGILDGAVLDRDILVSLGKADSASCLLTSCEDSPQKESFFQSEKQNDKPDLHKVTHNKEMRLEKRQKITAGTWLSILILLIAVPATVLFGVYAFDDRKYYFTSLLIIFETMIASAAAFESSKPSSGKLVMLSVLSAAAVAGRIAFYAFPQFKPMAAVVIITGVCFGAQYGFLTGAASAFISNFFFGQGSWTPWQMFGFGIVGFFAGLLFYRKSFAKNVPLQCIYGFLSVLVLYGGIMNISSVLAVQPYPDLKTLIAAFASGFVFDLIHAFSTLLFLLFISKPLTDRIERIKTKYGF